MQKLFNSISFRKIGYVILTLIWLFAIARTISDFSKLVTSSYKIKSDQIVRIDKFAQQGKADYLRSSKGSIIGYQLKSTTGYSFTIDNVAFEGVTDKHELDNLLKYHELNFIAYSDKFTLEQYSKSKSPIGINVLQFQVGEKKYIDIDKGNSKVKRNLLWLTTGEIVCVIALSLWFLKEGRIDRFKV